MHRIDRPKEPKAFRRYREAYLKCHPWPDVKPNPRDDWNSFGSVALSDYDPTHRDGAGERKTLKALVLDTLANNQHGLCAYCEEKLPSERSDRRIEHHHPKSDVTTAHCWMFDWENLLAVCSGGATNNVNRTPDSELHCDAKKEDCPTPILNPYTMPGQCLFSFKKDTGELLPDEGQCSQARVDVRLVENTIKVLNLNCSVLKGHRRNLAMHYKNEYQKEQRLMQAGKTARGSVRDIIARRWFGQGQVPDLWTTRRLLLKNHAEHSITGKV